MFPYNLLLQAFMAWLKERSLMFNKFFNICVSLILVTLPLAAQNHHTGYSSTSLPKCSPQLQKHFNAILEIPEAKKLVEGIQSEGAIQIVAERTKLSRQFGAFWDPDRRLIVIDTSLNQSDGSIIGSILFELHNASVNTKINQLNRLASTGGTNKSDYVRSMEYLEYVNSLNASKISEKGIQMGIFPQDAYLSTYTNFSEHYKAQRESGHSDAFAHNFDICKKFG